VPKEIFQREKVKTKLKQTIGGKAKINTSH
jgi:hypothetical protein